MKNTLSLLILLFSSSAFASAIEFDCRTNTINGTPIVRVWGLEKDVWVKLKKVPFKNAALRDAALDACMEYAAHVKVVPGPFEFKIGGSAIQATFSKKGYALVDQYGQLVFTELKYVKDTHLESLQLGAELIASLITR